MATAQQPNIIGQVIANCLIEKKLGAGGMGAVFLGTHQGLRHKVAIKVLPAVPPPPQQFVQRFFREARALAALEHKNIVHVFDVGQQDPYYYIVMQFVEAQSLEQTVRDKGKLSISLALRFIRDIADAMAYAHDKGILHRDLKPDNVLISKDNDVKIIDFGLAKFEGGGESQALTVTGQIMGTPMYMAPEQAEGKNADARTDIYSLGALGFYILTADYPFVGKSGMDILLKKIKEKPRDILQLRPEIPVPVANLINKMMARDPEKRFQSMHKVRDILNQALKPKSEAAAQGAMNDAVIDEVRQASAAGSGSNAGLFAQTAGTPASAMPPPRATPGIPPPPTAAARPALASAPPMVPPPPLAATPPPVASSRPGRPGSNSAPMMHSEVEEAEPAEPRASRGNGGGARRGQNRAPVQQGNSVNTMLLVLVVILLLAVLGLGGFIAMQMMNKDKENQNNGRGGSGGGGGPTNNSSEPVKAPENKPK